MRQYIIEYSEEKKFKEKKELLKKYSMLAYKKLVFDFVPSFGNGEFSGTMVSKCGEQEIIKYELKLPTDRMFAMIHGDFVLHYTVYENQKLVVLDTITPEEIFNEKAYKNLQNEKLYEELKKEKLQNEKLQKLKPILYNDEILLFDTYCHGLLLIDGSLYGTVVDVFGTISLTNKRIILDIKNDYGTRSSFLGIKLCDINNIRCPVSREHYTPYLMRRFCPDIHYRTTVRGVLIESSKHSFLLFTGEIVSKELLTLYYKICELKNDTKNY